jgi:DNA-binding MarR family transcriptional regulator
MRKMLSDNEMLPQELDILNRLTGYTLDFNAMTVVTNLYRAGQGLKVKMEREVLSEYGLSFTAFSILYNLWIWGSMETRNLAKSAGVTVATVSSIANTLERKQLCQRMIDEKDRRLVHLSLTPKGKEIIEELYPKFNQGEKAIVKGIAEEDQQKITKLLRRIIRNMNQEL